MRMKNTNSTQLKKRRLKKCTSEEHADEEYEEHSVEEEAGEEDEQCTPADGESGQHSAEVEAPPRKRSRSPPKRSRLEATENHNSTGVGDETSPADALQAALNKMVEERARDEVSKLEKKMKEMRDEMNALITNQRTSNDELQRLRTELAKEKAVNKQLKDGQQCDVSSFGVKKIGKLDANVFKRACLKRFPVEEAEIRGAELCSTWQENLSSLSYSSFVRVLDNNGNNKVVVKGNDSPLRRLKEEWGVEAYDAVVTAYMDLHGYSFREIDKDKEVWNFKENRKAKLEEVISWLRSGTKELLGSRYIVVSIK